MTRRMPKGCDQQGRYPEAFESSELHDEELEARRDRLDELSHKALEVCCWLSVVAMVVAMANGWLPEG